MQKANSQNPLPNLREVIYSVNKFHSALLIIIWWNK